MSISRREKARFRLLFGPALILATWFALTPNPAALPDVTQMDKWAHLATYIILAFLVDASWSEQRLDLPKWVFLLAYGTAIELTQSQVPNLILRVADLAANAEEFVSFPVKATREK